MKLHFQYEGHSTVGRECEVEEGVVCEMCRAVIDGEGCNVGSYSPVFFCGCFGCFFLVFFFFLRMCLIIAQHIGYFYIIYYYARSCR